MCNIWLSIDLSIIFQNSDMFPGPTIEANQGDRIIVNVTNRLDNAT